MDERMPRLHAQWVAGGVVIVVVPIGVDVDWYRLKIRRGTAWRRQREKAAPGADLIVIRWHCPLLE